MIRKVIVIIFVVLGCYDCLHAQFNTIGRTENSRSEYIPRYTLPIEDNDPMDEYEEEPDTLTAADSYSLADSLLSVGRKGMFSLPVEGKLHITSLYGMRMHPTLRRWKFHNGIDIRARYVPVLAMMPGYIYKVGYDKVSGKYVTLKHGDIFVSYCHLSEVWVKEGQFISVGFRIAKSGNTGRSSSPHLHLCCRIRGKRIDMLHLLVAMIEIME